jgi:N6-L-threonylcarbamoyladenine synthase
LLHQPNLDFSFAGLKTAVMTTLQKLGPDPSDAARADLAASAQAAIVDVLVQKSIKAMKATGLNRLVVAGSVRTARCALSWMPWRRAGAGACTIPNWRCAPTTAR